MFRIWCKFLLFFLFFSQSADASFTQKLLYTIDWTKLAGYSDSPTDGYTIDVSVMPLLNGGSVIFVQELPEVDGVPLNPPRSGYINYINNKGALVFNQAYPYQVELEDCETASKVVNNGNGEAVDYLDCPIIYSYAQNISGQKNNVLIDFAKSNFLANYAKKSTYNFDVGKSMPVLKKLAEYSGSFSDIYRGYGSYLSYSTHIADSDPNVIIVPDKDNKKTNVYSITFK